MKVHAFVILISLTLTDLDQQMAATIMDPAVGLVREIDRLTEQFMN
jgi:hypothetical protein